MENKEQAEIQQLQSEAERNKAEKKKLELETLELQKRLKQKWFSGRIFLQASIGGVVGAALLVAWLVGYFSPILLAKHELVGLQNSKLAMEAERDKKNNERLRERLEKQRKQYKSQLKQLLEKNSEFQKAQTEAEKRANTLKKQLKGRKDQYDEFAKTQVSESERQRYEKLAEDTKVEIAQLKTRIQVLNIEKDATKTRAFQVLQQIGNIDNDRYIIVVYGLNAPEDKYEAIKQYFLVERYTIDRGENLSSRPNWFALNSTVFFYHEKTEARAKQIATELSRATESKFRTTRGAGIGLVEGEEKWKVVVHYIPK